MESNEKGATMPSKTYENVGAALADPTSSIARFARDARDSRREYEQAVERLMAQGLTREQAWHKALFG